MTIIEFHGGPPKPPMRFPSERAAQEAMRTRRTGPYDYERLPRSGRWYVKRRIDHNVLCADGRWRHHWKVAIDDS